MIFELYFATFAQAVASFSPNAFAASILFSGFFSVAIITNGVVVPVGQVSRPFLPTPLSSRFVRQSD